MTDQTKTSQCRKWCSWCSFYYTEMAEYVAHVKSKHPVEAWWIQNSNAVPT